MIPVFDHWQSVASPWTGGAIALGNFDGVHRGHQALIARTAEQARALEAPVAIGDTVTAVVTVTDIND